MTKYGLTAALFSHSFVVLFHKVVYSHSIGVVSHLSAVLLKHNRERFLLKFVKMGTLILKIYEKYKGSFFFLNTVGDLKNRSDLVLRANGLSDWQITRSDRSSD